MGGQHFLLALGASEGGQDPVFEIKETHTLMIAACELFPLMNRIKYFEKTSNCKERKKSQFPA
jgi:hypothetical protein